MTGNLRIRVLNPNSSRSVTDMIASVTESLHVSNVTFTVDQLSLAPPALETDQDGRVVEPLVVDYVARNRNNFDAFIIACHGDPGMTSARKSALHVFGIGETSMLAACTAASRFGLLTLGPALVASKWKQVGAAGLSARCASVEPTYTGVLDGTAKDVSLEPYQRAGEAAVALGAEVLVLGCAGMATVAGGLASALQVPVIEPVSVTCRIAAAVLINRLTRHAQI